MNTVVVTTIILKDIDMDLILYPWCFENSIESKWFDQMLVPIYLNLQIHIEVEFYKTSKIPHPVPRSDKSQPDIDESAKCRM